MGWTGCDSLLVATPVLALILAAVSGHCTRLPFWFAGASAARPLGPLVVVTGEVVVAVVVAAVGVRRADRARLLAAATTTAAAARLVVVTETVVLAVEVTAVRILRAALHRGYTLCRRGAARVDARLVVVAYLSCAFPVIGTKRTGIIDSSLNPSLVRVTRKRLW